MLGHSPGLTRRLRGSEGDSSERRLQRDPVLSAKVRLRIRGISASAVETVWRKVATAFDSSEREWSDRLPSLPTTPRSGPVAVFLYWIGYAVFTGAGTSGNSSRSGILLPDLALSNTKRVLNLESSIIAHIRAGTDYPVVTKGLTKKNGHVRKWQS